MIERTFYPSQDFENLFAKAGWLPFAPFERLDSLFVLAPGAHGIL